MTTKFRIREDPKNKSRKEYYKAGHYDFFQLENETNKQDPIIAGPNLEPYCPNLAYDAKGSNLVTQRDILAPGPMYYGCNFQFKRGICFDPTLTTETMGMEAWERASMKGNCGPICPATMRPWFPSKVLLTVCFDMEEKACCYPNQDFEIEEFYYGFLTAGDRCKEELIPAKRALRRIFCMACHQDSGKYIQNGKVKICKSLALKLAPEKFDKCGVLKPEERGTLWFGDDMVTPSAQWGVGLAGAIAMLKARGGGDPQQDEFGKVLNAIKNGSYTGPAVTPRIGAFPPFINEDYEIEIVDNCLLDKYNPYTGITTECAQTDPNVTCYDMYDASNSIMASLVVMFVSLTVVLL